ncbi:hypothetical protein ACN20G_33245 (plasmid) [Streptomyces sp. BI20]|uniref:hypothetical protein n=1 Tax=Streptomyces sp. BI20 TaxID=3403460 RepID=UPI003C79715B
MPEIAIRVSPDGRTRAYELPDLHTDLSTDRPTIVARALVDVPDLVAEIHRPSGIILVFTRSPRDADAGPINGPARYACYELGTHGLVPYDFVGPAVFVGYEPDTDTLRGLHSDDAAMITATASWTPARRAL